MIQVESILMNHATKKSFGRGLADVLSGRQGDELSLLCRYETSLERSLFKSLAELRTLQSARNSHAEIEIGFVSQNCIEEVHENWYTGWSIKESLVASLSQYFDHIALSEEQIAEVTSYLKKIHESESLFHTESLAALRKEQDRIQKRINQMYDDKLDGLIDEKMYLDKVKDYKTRQAEIIDQMARHEKADHNFYATANMVMNLAARAREIFEGSEVDEKRQLLNFVFQNLKLDGKNLSIDTCEPFTTLVDYKKSPKGWGRLDSNQRRPKSRDLQSPTTQQATTHRKP